MAEILIYYHRPPCGLEIYRQVLLRESPEVKVTLLARYTQPTVRVGEQILLEQGAPALWFTFPGAWHDIGRFHRADGTVTGLYANILTPVVFAPGRWETTDLFLDLWIPPGGPLQVLDEEEFARAVADGWLDLERAKRAREEVARLQEAYREGSWPPSIVRSFRFDPRAR